MGNAPSCNISHNILILGQEEFDVDWEDVFRTEVMVDGRKHVVDVINKTGTEPSENAYDAVISNAEGFLIVYNINSAQSFKYVTKIAEQIARVRQQPIQKLPVVLVGNKPESSERREISTSDKREVSFNEGMAGAETLGCPFYEAWASQTVNMQESLDAVVYRSHGLTVPPASVRLQN
eukprot:TRINITY_DN1011_c0_g1_i1.p1 TRINITY_DN1011_c0_g1~~TRINITY_DN1011_c0_g1_i1.p1  ORF type:complete len:178 (-),score=30.54 TRINITY_DN1011_c0_g1_i1:131-664(-)